MALGAKPHAVVATMLKQCGSGSRSRGLIRVGAGLALVSLTSSAIAEVDASNPVAFSLVLAFLAGVALLASYLPTPGAAG